MGQITYSVRSTVLMLFTVLAFTVTVTSCGGGSKSSSRGAAPVRVPTPTSVPSTQPPQYVDLQITNISLETSSQGNEYRTFVVNVRNREAGVAQGFDISCTWQCPAGDLTLSAGTSVVQAGFLDGNSQRTYRREDRLQCTGPPAVLNNVTCTVDINQDVAETNEQNNEWQSQLNVPF